MVSTHWDMMVPDPIRMRLGMQRHREMESTAWRDIIDQNGRALALYPGGSGGALRVIDNVLEHLWRGTLRLQREINDDRIELRSTSAGKLLFERVEEMMQILEERLQEIKREIQETLRERDERHASDLRREFEEIRQDMRAQTQAVVDLGAQMKDISIRETRKAEEDRVKLQELMLETQSELTRLRNRPSEAEMAHVAHTMKQRDMVWNLRQTHLPSHSSNAEFVGAAAGIAGATFGAMALCSVM